MNEQRNELQGLEQTPLQVRVPEKHKAEAGGQWVESAEVVREAAKAEARLLQTPGSNIKHYAVRCNTISSVTKQAQRVQATCLRSHPI